MAFIENDLPILPLEIIRRISYFLLGTSLTDANIIWEAINKKLFQDLQKHLTQQFKAGLFSQTIYVQKLEEADSVYSTRLHRNIRNR